MEAKLIVANCDERDKNRQMISFALAELNHVINHLSRYGGKDGGPLASLKFARSFLADTEIIVDTIPEGMSDEEIAAQLVKDKELLSKYA